MTARASYVPLGSDLVAGAVAAVRDARAYEASTLLRAAAATGALNEVQGLGGYHRKLILDLAFSHAWQDADQRRLLAAISTLAAGIGAIPAITVTVPCGTSAYTVTISANCLECGGPRGQIHHRPESAADAGPILHPWSNPCRHQDTDAGVMAEAGYLPWPETVR